MDPLDLLKIRADLNIKIAKGDLTVPAAERLLEAIAHPGNTNYVWEPDRNLAYPDRWQQAIDQGTFLNIYLPAPNTLLAASIAARSGIVGQVYEAHPDTTLIYFEGWVHGAAQYAHRDTRGQWEAAVEHAANRMLTRYPTIASRQVASDALTQIGIYVPGEPIWLSDEGDTLLTTYLEVHNG